MSFPFVSYVNMGPHPSEQLRAEALGVVEHARVVSALLNDLLY